MMGSHQDSDELVVNYLNVIERNLPCHSSQLRVLAQPLIGLCGIVCCLPELSDAWYSARLLGTDLWPIIPAKTPQLVHP